MAYHKFKDSKGREFEANVCYESGRSVDKAYGLEDAYYLDGEKEDVSEDEIDYVYNLPGNPVNLHGEEDSMS